ncbi:MAG: hypothetical protein ACFE9S_15675 [Candidatus Hermodarchaeota archaeon]
MRLKTGKKQQTIDGYKGVAPLRIDIILSWIVKLILQVLIFTIIYTISIDKIRESSNNNLGIEMLFVFIILIGSDIFAYFLSMAIKIIFNNKMRYIPSRKKKGLNYNRKVIEYTLYTLFRCLCYIIGFTSILVLTLNLYMPIFFAYFLTWIFIFIFCKIPAVIISIFFTKSV